MDRSADMLWIGMGAFFLGSSRTCLTLLGQHERFPYMGTTHKKRMCGVCGLAR
jgi:hypothetical protein